MSVILRVVERPDQLCDVPAPVLEYFVIIFEPKWMFLLSHLTSVSKESTFNTSRGCCELVIRPRSGRQNITTAPFLIRIWEGHCDKLPSQHYFWQIILKFLVLSYTTWIV